MRASTRPCVRVGRRGRKAHGLQHAKVRQVVAHEHHFIQLDPGSRGDPANARQLVVDRHVCGDIQFGRASHHDRTGARRHHGNLQAGLAEQGQALPVQDVEGLELASVAVEQQAPVGQRAVDVETGQPDPRRAGEDVGGIVAGVGVVH